MNVANHHQPSLQTLYTFAQKSPENSNIGLDANPVDGVGKADAPLLGGRKVTVVDNPQNAGEIRQQFVDNLMADPKVSKDYAANVGMKLLQTGNPNGTIKREEMSHAITFALSSPAHVNRIMERTLHGLSFPSTSMKLLFDTLSECANHPDVVDFLTRPVGGSPNADLLALRKVCKVAVQHHQDQDEFIVPTAYLRGFAGGISVSEQLTESHISPFSGRALDAEFKESTIVQLTKDPAISGLLGGDGSLMAHLDGLAHAKAQKALIDNKCYNRTKQQLMNVLGYLKQEIVRKKVELARKDKERDKDWQTRISTELNKILQEGKKEDIFGTKADKLTSAGEAYAAIVDRPYQSRYLTELKHELATPTTFRAQNPAENKPINVLLNKLRNVKTDIGHMMTAAGNKIHSLFNKLKPTQSNAPSFGMTGNAKDAQGMNTASNNANPNDTIFGILMNNFQNPETDNGLIGELKAKMNWDWGVDQNSQAFKDAVNSFDAFMKTTQWSECKLYSDKAKKTILNTFKRLPPAMLDYYATSGNHLSVYKIVLKLSNVQPEKLPEQANKIDPILKQEDFNLNTVDNQKFNLDKLVLHEPFGSDNTNKTTFSFQLKNCAGDGNCFFSSVINGMNSVAGVKDKKIPLGNLNVNVLRTKLAEHFQDLVNKAKSPDASRRPKGLLVSDTGEMTQVLVAKNDGFVGIDTAYEDLKEKRLQTNGQWVDTTEAALVADLLKRPVVVLERNNHLVVAYDRSLSDGTILTGKPIVIMHDGNHFQQVELTTGSMDTLKKGFLSHPKG